MKQHVLLKIQSLLNINSHCIIRFCCYFEDPTRSSSHLSLSPFKDRSFVHAVPVHTTKHSSRKQRKYHNKKVPYMDFNPPPRKRILNDKSFIHTIPVNIRNILFISV